MPREVRFDAKAEFVATKAFRCQGHEFRIGDKFDKSLVPAHRLRQMVEASRQLRQAENRKPRLKIEVGSPILEKPAAAPVTLAQEIVRRRRPVTNPVSHTA